MSTPTTSRFQRDQPMSEPTMTYAPDRAARFLNQGPPAERLQRQMRLIADQQRVLRLVAANVCQLLTEGGVGDREQLARLLDECVGEIGRLVQEAT